MAETPQQRRPKVMQVLSIAVVIALSAMMFSASAALTKKDSGRHPEDLSDLVRVEMKRQDELAERTDALRAKFDELTAQQANTLPAVDKEIQLVSGISTGLTPVSGPGIQVVLTDAPPQAQNLEGWNPDDLVVHQQDLQAVINALWAGGAESMTLQGQRVTPLTAFKCVGNVLLLHGQVYSPPFKVEAIGDLDSLTAALDASPAITTYKQYVQAVGLGWFTQPLDNIEMPAATNISTLKFATVPQGTDVWD
ncbi:DUF881 domain-containing protein [Timonella senegalensis]|uniref:DUF881 domain-containing protein n=1 Tax=Timonella senegalensis TaxID=1465825 RepID=UPI00058D7A40|nr:DUF881 domain-containing protein [Timonella senegalensis]